MIRKTERRFNRIGYKWDRGYTPNPKVVETVQRKTWWLLFVIPVYSQDTILLSRILGEPE